MIGHWTLPEAICASDRIRPKGGAFDCSLIRLERSTDASTRPQRAVQVAPEIFDVLDAHAQA